MALDPGDKLVGVAITDGTKDILLFTTGGKAIRFVEEEVRAMGREAAGVRGVKLSDEQRVNALIVAQDGFILTASQNGFGKLTPSRISRSTDEEARASSLCKLPTAMGSWLEHCR